MHDEHCSRGRPCPIEQIYGVQRRLTLLNSVMKILREIVLLFMLSFVTPTVNAMSVVAVQRSVITLNIDNARMLRSRHRIRRYGFLPLQQWELMSI